MAKRLIRTFTTDAGGKPVDDWAKSLDPAARAEVALSIDLAKARRATWLSRTSLKGRKRDG